MISMMLKNWRNLLGDDNGNIAILFGLSSIPLLLILGGAVDFSRYLHYKTDLANAVDAGSLALARNAELFADECETVGEVCPQAGEFVGNFVAALFTADSAFELGAVSVTRTETGFNVSIDGDMQTAFLPLGSLLTGNSVDKIAVDIEAGVSRASTRLELALVFDNTGSMGWTDTGSGTRMDGLKSAANGLLDVLMPADAEPTEDIKIAVVPFEGTVNILNDSFNWNWIDRGQYQEWSVTTGKGKHQTTTTYKKWYGRSKYNGINVSTVQNRNGGNRRPSHYWLYQLINVQWAGCVEMRQEHVDAQTGTVTPHDILDTAPDQTKPETLFVQSFWVDEPDAASGFSNNYLVDDTGSRDILTQQKNFSKYETNSQHWIDTTWPYETGPNRGCPKPIVPLTTSRTEVKDTIDAMQPYGTMGTYIPTGLVWGWHVLSPGEPFSEGIAPDQQGFERTVKAIVLLTDGENSVSMMENINKTVYNGYNYFTAGRLGTVADNASADGPNAQLNAKTLALCDNVKADEIRVYTITFGAIPESAKSLMRNCASESEGERLYYHAPTGAALESVFKEIGANLSNLHLSM